MNAPELDLDFYSDEGLANPYPLYQRLRDAAPVVFLPRLGMYAMGRYKDVRAALGEAELFTSSQGVMMNQLMNDTLRGITLCTDGEEHRRMRHVINKPLTTPALRLLREPITKEAEALVERLVAQHIFDAATELAQHLPVAIVSDQVGLPEEGRERMLDWAAANFNCFGPLNTHTTNAFPVVQEMVHYAFHQAVPGKLKPGGWAAGIYAAADRGEIRPEQCPVMMNDYMGPSLDTTIFGVSSMIWLLAEHPGEWEAIRADPSLIPSAVNESLRLESPIQGFSRVATRDCDVDGVQLPSGSRVIVFYGSANRDERKWADASVFNVRRRATEHLAFGYGDHLCVGMNLARMEMEALLQALVKRVKHFELLKAERALNNVLRGFKTVRVRVTR